MNIILKLLVFTLLVILLYNNKVANAKSIIFANYYNVILYYPAEYGGNDDLRVVFDVRNVTAGTFKYIPIVVDVAYDSLQNIAYAYLESAIQSYIILLKWFGGKWCYQVMFEFASSTYSNYMYHSLVTLDNFVYWTADRYVMSGRIPGYEMRRLMQPGWERIYRMSLDKPNKQLYVASFDYGENVIYGCNILRYSCVKLTTTPFPINSIYFDSEAKILYVGSVQVQTLYRYDENIRDIVKVPNVQAQVSDMAIFTDNVGVFTNRETISVCKDLRKPNCIRLANPRLVDPYALQFVFTFDHVSDFSNYPYPYSDFQDILWKDKQYLFHLHILGIDYVENDYAFLPEMDLNMNFLRVDSCVNIFYDNRLKILVPALIAGGAVLLILSIAVTICICKSKRCGYWREKKKGKETTAKKASNLSTISTSTTTPLQMQTTEKVKNNKKSSMVNTNKIIRQSPHLRSDYILPKGSISSVGNNNNKIHSTGIYIMGKNGATRDSSSYAESDSSQTTESYLNPKYPVTKLQSKPLTSNSRLNLVDDRQYQQQQQQYLVNTLPMSIDSNRSYNYIDDRTPNQTRYVSSYHVPIYGSTNAQNLINIRKAVSSQNDKTYQSLSDENDSYNMMLV